MQVLTCMCIFLARFGMHGIACIYFLPWHGFLGVTLFSTMSWVFPSVTIFPDSFDEMGFLIRFMWGGQIRFEAEWGGSLN